ncbi:DUF3885 domain-containing protein [Chromobacterium violaceum]|uniref:DUF3885 domain-containing protein n=1 Tax=Chromobacterium violaceum TaxID=536 RepID=UPI001B33E9CB|nr:DUF3885 domain-containing protein [Chromobacterium violaceum]MBP4047419.1 DUF3885 domain-containing protein [Chromobacterium violaceum]
MLKLKDGIEGCFAKSVFDLPLFYSNKNSIRIELADDDCSINQFLMAMAIACPIVKDVAGDEYAVCLRFRLDSSIFELRKEFNALRDAVVLIPKSREIWVESISCDVEGQSGDGAWLYIAFHGEPDRIENILWCALSKDLGVVKPSPNVMVYIFNFENEVVIHPYDARGMDISGRNFEYMSSLYFKYRHYLFSYDLDAMSLVFECEK